MAGERLKDIAEGAGYELNWREVLDEADKQITFLQSQLERLKADNKLYARRNGELDKMWAEANDQLRREIVELKEKKNG